MQIVWKIVQVMDYRRKAMFHFANHPVIVDRSGRAVLGVGVRPLAWFESRWGHGYMSLLSVVFWQVEASA